MKNWYLTTIFYVLETFKLDYCNVLYIYLPMNTEGLCRPTDVCLHCAPLTTACFYRAMPAGKGSFFGGLYVVVMPIIY